MKSREITDEKLVEARGWFIRRGISLKSWAAQHQVKPNVLYQVLEGKTRCTRGESHRIAVLLGLKDAVGGDLCLISESTQGAMLHGDQHGGSLGTNATRAAMPEVN